MTHMNAYALYFDRNSGFQFREIYSCASLNADDIESEESRPTILVQY